MTLKSLPGAVLLVAGLLLSGHPSFLQAQDCDGNEILDVDEIAMNAGLDCDVNGILDFCEIVADAGLDCDVNGTLDSCEIAADAGLDCNTNGVLDACELRGTDCNSNGVLDACDISGGAEDDCDENGIPDACEINGSDCNANGTLDACDISEGDEGDCDQNGIPDACEIEGNDCNSNGTLDACDIAEGDEDDCDQTGIPDACETQGLDCNTNGTPDACELRDGAAQDCNLNGIPDECDLEDGAEDCNDNGTPDECDVIVGVNFGTPVRVTVARDPVFLLAADVDDDDDLDLLVGNLAAVELAVLTNDGNGQFEQTASYPVGASPHSVTQADLDGDGDLDLATANERAVADHISILWYDKETGKFDSKNLTLGNSIDLAPSDIVAGDIDDDDDVDLVVTSFRSGHVSVLANDGAGDFTVVQTLVVAQPAPRKVVAYRVEIADLDKDGDLDLAVANTDGNDVPLFSNDGNGVFAPAGSLQPGRGPNWIIAVDIDGDRDTDLVTSNEHSDTVAIFLNTGAGGALSADTFAPARIFPAGPDAISVKAGDVDGDGDLDLVVANNFASFTVSILVNSGSLAFSSPVQFVTDPSVELSTVCTDDCDNNGIPDCCIGPRWVVLAKLDGDDKPDLAVANRHGNSVVVRSNASIPPASDDCDGGGVPDECEPDCNGNGLADSCDIVAGTSSDCNSDGLPDDCQEDCNENGVPDGCDVSEGTSEDANQNGKPDECDPPVLTTLGDEPEQVVFDDGTRALAFVGSMTATNANEDSVWNSATFENVDAGDPSALVNQAKLYLDQNGNQLFDEQDLQIGSASFDAADTHQITFQNLQAQLPTDTSVTFFLVLELKNDAGAALVFPGIRFPGAWITPGLLLLFASCLLVLGAAAGRRAWFRIPGYLTSVAAVLIVAGLLAPGCSSGGGGGGGGGAAAAVPAQSRQLRMQLTGVNITGAQTGQSSVTPGLPLEAWSFEA